MVIQEFLMHFTHISWVMCQLESSWTLCLWVIHCLLEKLWIVVNTLRISKLLEIADIATDLIGFNLMNLCRDNYGLENDEDRKLELSTLRTFTKSYIHKRMSIFSCRNMTWVSQQKKKDKSHFSEKCDQSKIVMHYFLGNFDINAFFSNFIYMQNSFFKINLAS